MTVKKTPFGLDLSKGYLPVMIVVSVLIASVVGAYNVGSVVHGFTTERDNANQRFANIERELGTIRGILEQQDYLRANDLKRWCTLTELINKGWKCADISQEQKR